LLEEWRVIPAFPKYSISSLGTVCNNRAGKELKPTKNQQGHLKVNFVKNGEHYTRSINQLVAKAYLPDPGRPDFNSIIHLDGDKTNCRSDNLLWRPRYFAIRYHQQFDSPVFQTSLFPVVETKSGEEYETAQVAAVRYGLIFSEIVVAVHNRTYVWPTFQEFRTLESV
jgi:hypothetical protein